MDRPAVLEVADQDDVLALERTFLVPDRVQVEQGLRRMLARAVAALMTGFSVKSAASRAAPSCGWRRTIASLYASTMRIVSARVSPFWTEVPSALLNPRARPPSRAIALSNESRVRVEGS